MYASFSKFTIKLFLTIYFYIVNSFYFPYLFPHQGNFTRLGVQPYQLRVPVDRQIDIPVGTVDRKVDLTVGRGPGILLVQRQGGIDLMLTALYGSYLAIKLRKCYPRKGYILLWVINITFAILAVLSLLVAVKLFLA